MSSDAKDKSWANRCHQYEEGISLLYFRIFGKNKDIERISLTFWRVYLISSSLANAVDDAEDTHVCIQWPCKLWRCLESTESGGQHRSGRARKRGLQ